MASCFNIQSSSTDSIKNWGNCDWIGGHEDKSKTYIFNSFIVETVVCATRRGAYKLQETF